MKLRSLILSCVVALSTPFVTALSAFGRGSGDPGTFESVLQYRYSQWLKWLLSVHKDLIVLLSRFNTIAKM